MRFYMRYAFLCVCLTSFSCVFWFYVWIADLDRYYSALPNQLKAHDSQYFHSKADGIDSNLPVVQHLNSQEAAKLIRDLGFDSSLNFTGFNNETGSKDFIVPNVIHYVRFEQARFTFVEYICVLSAYFQQRPDYIFIHTDVKSGFKGKYWRWILEEKDLAARIRVLFAEAPDEIFGQKLNSEWRLLHGSDLARIRTMMMYGGIYLDTDVLIVQNLDKYRKFEIALGWPQDQSFGTQVMIGHKNARFPALWLNCYREYRADDWYYNAGERPTIEVLEKNPELVHRVAENFGVQDLSYRLYQQDDCKWPDWRKLDSIHLLINHRWYLDPHHDEYRSFNERNIVHYPYTFGEMARLVMSHAVKHRTNRSETIEFLIRNHPCMDRS